MSFPPIHRVVTGHDDQGKAVVASNGPLPTVVELKAIPGTVFHEVWETRATPASVDSGADPTIGALTLPPPKQGTRIRFVMPGVGKPRQFHMEVSEPEPGRVLRETDLKTGTITTFTVEPTDDASICRVIMRSEWRRGGLMGWVERWFAKPFLRRIYIEELHNLAVKVRGSRTDARECELA